MTRALLALAALAPLAAETAPDAVTVLAQRLAPPARFAEHRPQFTVAQETFAFKGGSESIAFWVIRDAGKVVGVVHPGMNQLDMTTFRPGRAPEQPAFKDYYSWGTLLGTRITTAAWYGGMSASGKVEQSWSAGGAMLTFTTVQTWSAAPNGTSRYEMTLSVDPVHGYRWDIATDLRVREPNKHKDGKLEVPEFLNWQARVREMGQWNGKRWPLAWMLDRKVFLNHEDKLVGFYLNPLAIDRSKYKRSMVREGGFVANLPDAEGWGIALVHLEKAPYANNNATCNMWSDSHNYLKLPEQPDAEGFHSVRARWRFQALVPEEVTDILARTTMDELGRSEFPSRLGEDAAPVK